LPDDLYQELKRVANQQEWSFAETVRRGAEYIVRVYPSGQSKPNDWSLPPGLDLGLPLAPQEEWTRLSHE